MHVSPPFTLSHSIRRKVECMRTLFRVTIHPSPLPRGEVGGKVKSSGSHTLSTLSSIHNIHT
jgi:hypothetical protein